MTEKKGTVEKERVVCQNCRYHYSFLYDAKEPIPDVQPNLNGNLRNFITPRECYRGCPHCGFYQDWMVKARRKYQMIDFLLVCMVGFGYGYVYFCRFMCVWGGGGREEGWVRWRVVCCVHISRWHTTHTAHDSQHMRE